ncbi:MAG: helix-turn-helix transcriptional regulator [Oscillospiraceae bacterium]|nr:helix-turn-helix transcriptional regulator [Oscillospiraceae bacterium]
MSIGERITNLRKACDLSQGQLAAMMGVSRQAISKWENDQTSPDTLNLIKLAEVLESDVAYLATGESTAVTVPDPFVMTVVKEVIKEVEKPVEVEVEIPVIKKVEVEKVVEVERIVEVEKPVIRRRIRVKYRDNPIHMLILGGGCFLIGLILGLIL